MSAVCVRMRVGVEHYALDVGPVRRVAELGQLVPVPGAPPAVVGVINVEGQVVPVVDTGLLLGAAGSERGRTGRVVIVDDGPRRTGLAVDEVVDVGPAPEPTEQPDSPFLTGAAVLDEQLIGFIDLDTLLEAVT